MNRRDVILSAPVAVLGAAAPVSAEVALTPVMQQYLDWRALIERRDGLGEEERDAIFDRESEIERIIMNIPAQSAADVVAKVVVYTNEGMFALMGRSDMPEFWAEADLFSGAIT